MGSNFFIVNVPSDFPLACIKTSQVPEPSNIDIAPFIFPLTVDGPSAILDDPEMVNSINLLP